MDSKTRHSWPIGPDPSVPHSKDRKPNINFGVSKPMRFRRGSVESFSSDTCSMSSPSQDSANDGLKSPRPRPIPNTTPLALSQSTSSLTCLLCKDNDSFSSRLSFYIHLTVTHFKQAILDLLKDQEPPYKCFNCDFQPSSDIFPGQQQEQLLMHLGCEDLLSVQLYEKAVQKLTQVNKPQEVEEPAQCQLCNVAFPRERLLSRHLTLMHFSDLLESRLPAAPPFSCPVEGCEIVKSSKRDILLHCGCEHNFSKDLYEGAIQEKSNEAKVVVINSCPEAPVAKQPQRSSNALVKIVSPDSNPSSLSTNQPVEPPPHPVFLPLPKPVRLLKKEMEHCPLCPKQVVEKQMTHHIFYHHFFPYLPKPLRCPDCQSSFIVESGFYNHYLASHFHQRLQRETNKVEYELETIVATPKDEKHNSTPGLSEKADSGIAPRGRVKHTFHSCTPKKTGSESIRHQNEIEVLKLKMGLMERTHKESVKKKEKDFERWITSKEKALEAEAERRKAAEYQLELVTIKKMDVVKISKSQGVMLKQTKEELEDSRNEATELLNKLKRRDQDLSESKVEAQYLKEQMSSLNGELKTKSRELTKLEEEFRSFKSNHESRDNSIKKLSKRCDDQAKEIKSLGIDKDCYKAQLSILEQVNQTKTDNLKEMEQKVKLLNAEIASLKQSSDRRTDQSSLEKDLRDLRLKHEDLIHSNQVKDQRLEALLKLNEDRNGEYDTDMTSLKNDIKKLQEEQTVNDAEIQKLNENNRKLKIEQETLVKIKKELTNRCFAWETRFEQKSKEALHLDLKLKEMNKMESLGSNPAAEAHNLAATTALRENIQKLKKSVADLEEKLLDSDNDKAEAEARLQCRTDELTALKTKHADFGVKMSELERLCRQKDVEIEETTAEMEKIVKNHELKSSHFQDSMKMWHSQVTKLKAEVSSLAKEKTALQKTLEERDIEPDLVFQHQVQEPQQPVKNLVQTGCLPLQKTLSSAVGSETATALSSVVNPPANSLVSIPIPATPFSQPQLLPAPATTNASPAIKIKLKIGPASKMVKNNVKPNPEVVAHIVSEKPSAEPTVSPLSTNSTYPERSPVLDERLLFQEPTSSKVAKPNQGKCTPVAKTTRGRKRKKASGGKNSTKKLQLEDVEWDDSQTECGICKSVFAPKFANVVSDDLYDYKVTDWVGCDCSNWFHQVCANLSADDVKSFTCSKVNHSCQGPPPAVDKH